MTPLPSGDITAWRLDHARFAASWDSGEGAYRFGGRWNTRGTRAVYCSIDPATAILEVAVHTGFRALDMVPHVLTGFTLAATAAPHIVRPADVPNPNWLRPGIPSAGQQEFGAALLARHAVVILPSAVSTHSWNLIFTPATADAITLRTQERFALDPRLHPVRPE